MTVQTQTQALKRLCRMLQQGLFVGLLSWPLVPSLALANDALNQPLRSIGISVADLGNPFFVELVDAVIQRANELNDGQPVEVVVRSDAYDLRRQVRQLDDFIAQKVDLIILTAADEYKIAPVVAKAQRAGIKVIAVDVNAHGADATITTDNVQAGVVACERLAQAIGYQGQFVIINGVSVSSVLERVAGCKSAIHRYPEITLLSDRLNGTGSQEGGMEAMTYLMEAYQHLDAVFAINDPTAYGALMAAQQAGRDEFVLASVDGSNFAIDTIQQPNLWIATAVQRPRLMAEKAVEIGLALLKGEEVRQRFILIPAQLAEKP
ncbi:D-ribose-binding periplasmic protein precursor [Marinomonas aquimarina]|uniref:D-ribose-binding periplasmic protein n=1 Tax=Marinomonas aquimarina TaxID=295068 RepID=A0A1A8TSG6_9GAMM|nr:substrate-binding domain-containing protein [Marinomonas aquimarina]SBS36251.1 D-ribose-binding periplasmic protein precursor [Marinomonas aquimarina]